MSSSSPASTPTSPAGSASKPSPRPSRIGVFIGRVDDSFQRAVWKSALGRARERGAEAIGFFGHGLGSPVPSQATMNVVYRMAGPRALDGLVVLSSTVGNFEEPAGIARLVADAGLPAVSIQFPLEGVPTLSSRGRPAMAALVRHLVRAHGLRRLALVTGPRRHIDSIERESSFREALAAEGLGFDERLLFEGQFFKESGAAAVGAFLASGAPFDAVVCLNDFMALGALEELRARGLGVPSEIAVTGYDDVSESRWTSPPLTTIHQPLEELGGGAVDMCLELLAGRAPASRSLDCGCVYRQSCGCPPALPLPEPDAEASVAREPVDDAEAGRLAEALRLGEAGDAAGVLRLLDEALEEGAGAARRGRAERPEAELARLWRRTLFGLRGREPEPAPGPGPGTARRPAASWIDQALAHLGEIELRREIMRGLELEGRYALIRELGARLLGTFSLDALVGQWQSCLGPMGIPRSFIVLFEGPVEPGGRVLPARSRLLEADPSAPSGVAHRSFPTALLHPAGRDFEWGAAGWIVEPLVYQDEALGYILIESGSEEAIAYEAMREQVSSAVKATLLMEENREHRRSLERQVELRTRELRRANRELEEEIERRKVLEREVQEVSNRTMQAIGQDLHDDLCQHLAGISVLAAAMEETRSATGAVPAASIREVRDLLGSALSRARQFARTLYPPSLEARGLVAALEDLVEAQRRASGSVSISLQTEGDCGVEDPATSLHLYRILQEALSNALRHSGSEVVLLRLFRREGALVAEVRDFGRGLDAGAGGRGMGMRIMRHRAESIGARLEIGNLEPGVRVSCVLGG